MKSYVVQIVERKSKSEVLKAIIVDEKINSVKIAKKQAYKTAQLLGYDDLLKYEIWAGTKLTFIKTRKKLIKEA